MKKITFILLLLLNTLIVSAKNLDVIIVFKSDNQIDDAKYLRTKELKGKFVYSQLVAQTKNQNEVQQFLNSKNIFFESFWIVNAVRVVADESIIAQLSIFKDIEKIVPNSAFTFSKPVSSVQQRTTDILGATWGLNKNRS